MRAAPRCWTSSWRHPCKCASTRQSIESTPGNAAGSAHPDPDGKTGCDSRPRASQTSRMALATRKRSGFPVFWFSRKLESSEDAPIRKRHRPFERCRLDQSKLGPESTAAALQRALLVKVAQEASVGQHFLDHHLLHLLVGHQQMKDHRPGFIPRSSFES